MFPTPPPPAFSEAFLDWFRLSTEEAWAAFQSRYFEGTDAGQFGSVAGQQRARWLGGLADEVSDDLEHAWAVRFPPDYRLFLRRLHAPDRPVAVTHANATRVPLAQRPFFRWFNFYNWLLDGEDLHYAFARPLEGLLFDVEHNDLWHPGWGEKPQTLDARKARVKEFVAQAPKLIPVLGHRYLLAEPCQAGNPVLSVHQSDIIVYGMDLRDYLLNEFAYFLTPGQGRTPDVPAEAMTRLKAIPFWGTFL